ncbi:MAG: VWA domain-containing protein, partial [Pyrinomonadaceae bacterium]
MRRILFICGAVFFSSVFTHAQEPDATEILRKVAAVYAGCRSYADEGSVKMEGRGVSSSTYHFRTAFVRPSSFRFDFYFQGRAPNQSSWIVWKNGELTRTSPAGINLNEPAFDAALLRMTPLSAGSSVTIPQLLLPDLFRNSDLLSLTLDLKVTGEEKIDGRKAFRIEGTLWYKPVKFWIDKGEYLILKIYRKSEMGSRPEESTVQYKPRLNSDIPPEDLIFPQPLYQFGAAPTSQPGILRLPNPPALTPRLRDFGSSLSRTLNEKAGLNGQRPTTDDDDVVRVETDLVVCPVLVVDAQEKIVTGLTLEDFIVREDDKPQEVASFSLGDSKDLPRSIVLVIDYSGSQLPYIRTSVEAAKMLVDKLNPKDRMALVTDDVKLLVDFTGDKELLKTQLDGLKTKALAGTIGFSEQYDALMATLNELFNREDIRPIIIFQTDGDQLEALKGNEPTNPYVLPRKYGLEDILTATEKTRATVYSVISGVRFA